MFPKKKTHDPNDLLPLYRKCCAICPSRGDGQALWLRIHVLLQGWQAVFDRPCAPAELSMLVTGSLDDLETHMPLLPHLLSTLPLPEPLPALPDDLLTALCALYNTTPPDLGQIYQSIQSPSEMKQKGQVFTPHSAVEHALALMSRPIQGKVLDLACGAGDYLLIAYQRLRESYSAQGVTPLDAHRLLLQEHLYGIDQDPLAVAITHCRLALLCPESPCVALHVIPLNAYHLFVHPLGQQRYEQIIGNPPWGGVIRGEDKKWIRQHVSESLHSLVHNSFASFLQSTVRLLAEGGQFSLLVPASFLNVQSYEPLRQWLLTQVRVEALHYVPYLFSNHYAPALFLVGTKGAPPAGHQVNVYPTVLSWAQWSASAACSSAPVGHTHSIAQSTFVSNPHTFFNLHHDSVCERLFARMREGALYLQGKRSAGKARVDFVMGIITGNNKRHISLQPLSPASQPIYDSADVEPFRLHPPKHYIVYNKALLKQAAPERKYQAPEKLLYRYISKELVTAIDRSGCYTLNNTNFLLPIDLPFTLRCLSALLNSTLLNTYYMYHFFTGKVLKSNLTLLPLRQPSPEMQAEIEQLVIDLETADDADLVRRLNQLVYHLYEINPEEQTCIEGMYQYLRRFPFI